MIGRGIDERKTTRIARAYQAAALLVGLFSLFWMIVFAAKGLTALAVIELFPVFACLACFVLVARRKFDLVLLVAQIGFLIFIIGFSLMFDNPEAGSPRVTHLFLPVLGMLAYLSHLRRPSQLQFGVIIASLVSFVVLHAADLRLPFAEPIPPDLRAVGIWLNPTIAALIFCASIYALQQRLAAPSGIARDLVGALRQGQLSLAYQPQVDRNGRVVGAEALLRWQHPTRGSISPSVFIPVAEEAGLMPIIGSFVLEEALKTLHRWQSDPTFKALTLSVNVSATQIHEGDFETSLSILMASNPIDPTRLRLELTESVLIAGLQSVAEKMLALKALGISVSLDDFGTGFSSLAYLRQLPVSELKIDRSFIAGVVENDRDAALVRSIKALAQDLKLATVAEGVETAAQFAFLREIGCETFQGWLFGHPVPRAEFEAALTSPPNQKFSAGDRRPPRLATG